MHARMCVAGPRPVQSTSTLSSQCHPSAVGTIHTTNVGQLEPVKQHKIACTIQPVTRGRARTSLVPRPFALIVGEEEKGLVHTVMMTSRFRKMARLYISVPNVQETSYVLLVGGYPLSTQMPCSAQWGRREMFQEAVVSIC